jgi:hypothetical protein
VCLGRRLASEEEGPRRKASRCARLFSAWSPQRLNIFATDTDCKIHHHHHPHATCRQIVAAVYSWKMSGQPGSLTRVMCCEDKDVDTYSKDLPIYGHFYVVAPPPPSARGYQAACCAVCRCADGPSSAAAAVCCELRRRCAIHPILKAACCVLRDHAVCADKQSICLCYQPHNISFVKLYTLFLQFCYGPFPR